MSDLVERLRASCDVREAALLRNLAADELDRLNAQALELCAEISKLRRERDLADAALHSLQTRWANRATEQELRGLLARVVPYLDRGLKALHRDIAAALAGAADQPKAARTPAEDACMDIFNDWDESEIKDRSRSVQYAWEAGRQLQEAMRAADPTLPIP